MALKVNSKREELKSSSKIRLNPIPLHKINNEKQRTNKQISKTSNVSPENEHNKLDKPF